jgi:hypothetical protein
MVEKPKAEAEASVLVLGKAVRALREVVFEFDSREA